MAVGVELVRTLLRATLEKIGMPQGEHKHNRNFGAIFFFSMPIFLEAIPKKANAYLQRESAVVVYRS